VGGCIVSWSSKTQPTVTLSSTEAEYVAASTCATEIKFIQMLLEEVMPNEEIRPATLFEDNTGAIYLMENQAVGNRTKHIDVRMHHIREMMQGPDARMRVMFTRSESNFADILTKNVSERIFMQLVPSLKSGDIANVIFNTINREDVKNQDCQTDGCLVTDRPSSSSDSCMSIVESTKEQTEGLNDHVQGQYWIPVKTRKKKGKTASLKGESTKACETSGVGSNKDDHD